MAFVAFSLVALGRVGAAGPAPMDSASTEAPQLALGRYLADPKRGEGWSATAIDIEASIENHTKIGRLRTIRRVLPFGRTEYEVLELEGDRTVRQQVIAHYLSAEKEASQTHDAGIAMTSANYRFRYRGTVPTASRLTWAFEVIPRKKRAGLIRGELWIDATSGLVLRQAGRLVRTPSIFLRRVNVTRDTEIGTSIMKPMITGSPESVSTERGHCMHASNRLIPLLVVTAAFAADLPHFREITITSSLKMGYQLVVADLNRDGKPDLIVVDERATDLAWYENPTWERHVLIDNVPRTINLDLYDYDQREAVQS